MDKDIETLLESWNLAEYKTIFAENNVTLDTLSFLDKDDISQLIKPIGDRARFSKNLAQWVHCVQSIPTDGRVTKLRHSTCQDYEAIHKFTQDQTSINAPDNSDVSISDITNLILLPTDEQQLPISTTSSESSSLRDIICLSPEVNSPRSTSNATNLHHNFKFTDLQDLLKQSLEGRSLLNLYRDSGLLTNNGRRKICNIIIKHIIEKDATERISSSILLNYAKQITDIFSQENISTYFIPYLSNSQLKIKRLAKGKLYDCLQNRRREYRGYLHSHSKENTTTSCDNQDPPTADVIEDIAWLKNSCDPWESVFEKWRKTTEIRRSELMKESHTIQSYMNTYPALLKPAGFHLLVYDFAHQYPESSEKLEELFPLYQQKILDLSVKKFLKHSDHGLKEFTQDYINSTNVDDESSILSTIETKRIYAFMFLPMILGNPTGKNFKKSSWRPSKVEVRDAFITHVTAEVNLKEVVARRKDKYFSLGLTFQPTIFIVGPSLKDIKKYYIIVNETFYVVNSIIEAVDVAFKLFYSLHCEFPSECAPVYSFLQKAFYKINTKWDKVFTAVNSLLADLDIK